MQRSPTIDILLEQDLSVPLNDAIGVSLEQGIGAHVEITVSSHSVHIVVHCRNQVTLFNVQVFEIETFLDFTELIRDDFLEADAFVVEQCDHAVVVTLVTQCVEAGSTVSVYIKLLLHILRWIPAFNSKVQGNILEIEITSDIKWRPAKLVLLDQHLKDVILVQLLISLAEA